MFCRAAISRLRARGPDQACRWFERLEMCVQRRELTSLYYVGNCVTTMRMAWYYESKSIVDQCISASHWNQAVEAVKRSFAKSQSERLAH